MNLKNSKFYKRIQELRHFSKEKIRKDREQRSLRTPALRGVEMALSESQCNRDIDLTWSQPSSPNRQPSSPTRQPSAPSRRKCSGGKSKVIKKKVEELPSARGKVLKPVKAVETDNDAEVDGFIELNKLRYRVACSGRIDSGLSRPADGPAFV